MEEASSKYLVGARDFTDAGTEMHALCQHLVVKDEVVGVLQQWQAGEHVATEGSIATVIFRELDHQEKILERSQEAIGNLLPDRHAAVQGLASKNARNQHHVIDFVCHHAGHGGNQKRRLDEWARQRVAVSVAGLAALQEPPASSLWRLRKRWLPEEGQNRRVCRDAGRLFGIGDANDPTDWRE